MGSNPGRYPLRDNAGMRLKGILVWAVVAAVVALSYRRWGWPGVALSTGILMMWVLLYVNRLMLVIRRASNRPRGHVDSAVMFNAQLRSGRTLMRVTAQALALGEPVQPSADGLERYRWSDDSASCVTCTFRNGRLVNWQLERPESAAD